MRSAHSPFPVPTSATRSPGRRPRVAMVRWASESTDWAAGPAAASSATIRTAARRKRAIMCYGPGPRDSSGRLVLALIVIAAIARRADECVKSIVVEVAAGHLLGVVEARAEGGAGPGGRGAGHSQQLIAAHRVADEARALGEPDDEARVVDPARPTPLVVDQEGVDEGHRTLALRECALLPDEGIGAVRVVSVAADDAGLVDPLRDGE